MSTESAIDRARPKSIITAGTGRKNRQRMRTMPAANAMSLPPRPGAETRGADADGALAIAAVAAAVAAPAIARPRRFAHAAATRLTGESVRRTLREDRTARASGSTPEASRALLKRADRAKKVDLAEVRPVDVREIELAVDALPEQEAREADLAAGANDQ